MKLYIFAFIAFYIGLVNSQHIKSKNKNKNKVCFPPRVLNAATNSCECPAVTCNSNQFLNHRTCAC